MFDCFQCVVRAVALAAMVLNSMIMLCYKTCLHLVYLMFISIRFRSSLYHALSYLYHAYIMGSRRVHGSTRRAAGDCPSCVDTAWPVQTTLTPLLPLINHTMSRRFVRESVCIRGTVCALCSLHCVPS